MTFLETLEINDKEIKAQLVEGFHTEFLSQIDNETYEVTCEDTARQALSYSLQARKLHNQIEASRKEIVRPHLDFQKAVKKFADDLIVKLDTIETRLQGKISDWMQTTKDNPFSRVDEIEVEDGKITTKTVWEFEVLDEREIPREYMTVDVAAVEKAIKNGVREVPGVRVYSREKTTMRVKN